MKIFLMEYKENSKRKTEPVSLQVLDCTCKPFHASVISVPRSVEQQLQLSKEILRLVYIAVLEEDYSSEWDSTTFAISKKNVCY
jgi:hypothetical protein